MRIICPGCSSHYEVDADKIGADGQLVRCAHCRDVWLARRPADAAAPRFTVGPGGEPPIHPVARGEAAPPIDFARAKARLRARPPLDTAGGRGALGSLGVAGAVLCAAAALLGARVTIARHLPATAPLYAALGLPAGDGGLVLRDVRSGLVAEGGRTVLTLQGSISNLGADATPVPPLSVVVRDAALAPLYTWTAPAPKPSLAKGETVAFQSRLAAPPAAGQDVRVSFAEVE